MKEQADLTSLTAATASSSSIHQDALTTHPRYSKCGYPTPKTNAQPTIKSATIAAACITTQSSAEDPEDHNAQSVTLEPNLPGKPEPGHTKAVGHSPRPALTNTQGQAAGADRAIPPAEAGTPTIATAKAHPLSMPTSQPTDQPDETDAA